MKTQFFKRLLNATLIAFFGFILGVGFVYLSSPAQAFQEEEDDFEILRTFTDVIGLVEKNYVEKVDLSQMVEGAIKGMLSTLDPHTSYMNKRLYKSLKEETAGEFGGLGIEINVKDEVLTVVSPIEDSPAFRAGIQAGDQIIKIEEEFTKNLSLEDAVKKMRGPKGAPITIFVARKGRRNLLPFKIVRDIIKVKSVRSRNLGEGYGYIRLAQFQDGSSKEFAEALKKLSSKDNSSLQGLVIDVRNNPGGLLNEAIRVADLFLKDGVVVYTEGRLESQKQKYYAHDDGAEPTYPIVLLVNEGSASASEIIAGALQDHKRALVLGKQTFGKGSVQTVLPMEDGDALRLTTALYFTKNGRSIQAEGIKPDIEVDLKAVTKEEAAKIPWPRVKEKDLPGAIKNPKNKPSKDSSEKIDENLESEEVNEREPLTMRRFLKLPLEELLKLDSQLSEALKLLKTWNAFHKDSTVVPNLSSTQEVAAKSSESPS